MSIMSIQRKIYFFFVCVGGLTHYSLSNLLGRKPSRSPGVMSVSLNTHTQEYGLKSLEGVCSTFEMVHKSHILRSTLCNASTELLGCFHKLNALESNKIAELLFQYYPLPRGTALAYLP